MFWCEIHVLGIDLGCETYELGHFDGKFDVKGDFQSMPNPSKLIKSLHNI